MKQTDCRQVEGTMLVKGNGPYGRSNWMSENRVATCKGYWPVLSAHPISGDSSHMVWGRMFHDWLSWVGSQGVALTEWTMASVSGHPIPPHRNGDGNKERPHALPFSVDSHGHGSSATPFTRTNILPLSRFVCCRAVSDTPLLLPSGVGSKGGGLHGIRIEQRRPGRVLTRMWYLYLRDEGTRRHVFIVFLWSNRVDVE